MVVGIIEPVRLISFVAVLPAANTDCKFCVPPEPVAQDTPVAVDVKTWPTVPVLVPSQRDPVKPIPEVLFVVPFAEKVFVAVKVLVASEIMFEAASKVNIDPEVRFIGLPTAVSPAVRTCCNVGIEATGTPVDHSTPVPAGLTVSICPADPVALL
jgi:hypothetical protein